jgi:hypothetical protein
MITTISDVPLQRLYIKLKYTPYFVWTLSSISHTENTDTQCLGHKHLRMLEPKRDEVTRHRKLHDQEHHHLYSLPNAMKTN